MTLTEAKQLAAEALEAWNKYRRPCDLAQHFQFQAKAQRLEYKLEAARAAHVDLNQIEHNPVEPQSADPSDWQ